MKSIDELTMVADQLPVAIWLGRVPGGEVVYTNEAFREVLGIGPPDGAARGRFVEPYGVHDLSGAPYPEEKMPFERVIAARATVVIDDLVIHRHDGRRVHLRVFAKPIFDDAGTLTHVLEAFIDITREVEAERARLEGERRLARSHRLESLGQLVAGIAHDFNNLLTVTKLVISGLRGTEPDESRRQALANVDAATDSGIGLIRGLLDFARRGEHRRAPVSLDAVAAGILEIASRTFDRRIAIHADLGAADEIVIGDAGQLEQVVMNLLVNARDAIDGTGSVTVRTRPLTVAAGSASAWVPGRYVLLEVTDTGSGIAPSLRDRVFEPYFTTKTWGPVKGTGLGLATVHGIVHTHGGTVEILDNLPHGTTMRVALPAQGESMPRRAPAAAPPAAAPALRAGVDPSLVLLIDDEPLVRAATAAALADRGYEVLVASDGASGIAAFAARRDAIAAVILDVVMPGLSAREVLHALLAIRDDLPVIVVSGADAEVELHALEQLGARASAAKPYDPDQLAATLRTVGARGALGVPKPR